MNKHFFTQLKGGFGKREAYVANGLIFPASQAQTPSPMNIENTDASGIYFPTFVSATGNTTTFNVDISGFVYDASNNRLGINKTSPAYNLDVSGTANITGNLSVDTNTLFVNASNNRVGVGISNPAYPLDVVGDAKFTTIRDAENSIGTNGQVLVSNGSALVWNDNRVDVNNTPNSALYHYLTFCDNNTTSQRIQIDKDALTYQPSTNNLGIGTLTPAFNLDVSGTANITGNLSVDTNTLFVDASNNRVGIGKTNPQTTLDISGNLLVSSNVLGSNAPLFVDVSNNRVGIAMRAQNPQAPLHVQSDNNNSTQVIISGGGSHSHTNRGLRIATYETSSYDAGVNLDAQFQSGELTFSTAGNPRMTIKNNGFVGIGTNAPTQALDISGNFTLSSQAGAIINNRYDTGSGGPTYLYLRRAYGTPASPTIITNANQGLGAIYLNGYNGTDFVGGAYISAYLDGITPTLTSMPTKLTLATTPSGSTTPVERMTIKNNGDVGIATTSPTNLLDVNGNSIRLRTARTPASASATGTTGEICWDSSYIYVCVNTNTWKRVAISTW